MSEWQELLLGDIIETNYSNFSNNDNWKVINYLDTSNITEGKVGEIQQFVIGKDKIPSRAKRKVAEGDIVYSTVRPNQRHYGIIKNANKNFLVSTGFTTIRSKKQADNLFIYWFLTQDSIVNFLQGIGENSTSTYPSIKASDIESLLIKLPPLAEQKSIAHILGTLDDKIELNRKMNETLESMAQALFKSWFVDFDPVFDNALEAGNEIQEELKAKAEKRKQVDRYHKLLVKNPELAALFPSTFEYNEVLEKWVPEGWEVKRVEDVSEKVFSGGTPNTKNEEYWNGNFGWFSSGETRSNFIVETDKTITNKGIENSSTKLSLPEDILIASAGQGNTRGQTSLNCIETYINQSVVGIRAIDGVRRWLYFNLKGRYDEMRMISDSHSIRGSLTTKLIKRMHVVIPSQQKLLEHFDKTSETSISKITSNKLETKILIQLRDILLPQLISGRVKTNNVQVQQNENK